MNNGHDQGLMQMSHTRGVVQFNRAVRNFSGKLR